MTDIGRLKQLADAGGGIDLRGDLYRRATCEVCGGQFTAKRSDAKTCSDPCRQKAHRRRHQHHVPVSPSSFSHAPGQKGYRATRSKKRGLSELAGTLNHAVRNAALAAHQLGITLEHIDVQAATRAADAPLSKWDADLTMAIRVLTDARGAVRAEQASWRRRNG